MLTPKQVKKELEKNLALQGLTETYEDVAVSRMQVIRHDVLQTRQFLDGVSEIYAIAKTAYLKQLALVLSKKQREKDLQFIRRNRKNVAVLISANHSLLGNIVLQTYKVYMDLMVKMDCDHVVLGKVGSYLVSSARPSVQFTEFPFDDYTADESMLKPIIDNISQYEKIIVVYPRFVSVLRQVPQVDDISGGVVIEQSLEQQKNYFFEPTSRDVMAYFEGQIIGSLFRQKILEAMLARYAARLTIMDSANQTVKKIVMVNERLKVTTDRRESNKKMLNSFAGLALWGEEQ
jgi:F0F1-type ATP synthase gamma subunit